MSDTEKPCSSKESVSNDNVLVSQPTKSLSDAMENVALGDQTLEANTSAESLALLDDHFKTPQPPSPPVC